MPSDNKKPNLKTISPEMRERRRIMSRMTSVEKKAYKWKCYDETAKPKLLELIEYCQSDNRICPVPVLWSRIDRNCSWHTDRRDFTKSPPLKKPLLRNVWNASSVEKRLRLLTQIYWCYKNYSIGSIYSDIMKCDERDWLTECYLEDKISLKIIKKEYSTWLGVDYHPKYSIWNYCENHEEEYSQRRKDKKLRNQKIRAAEKLYCEQERDLLDDESITSINKR